MINFRQWLREAEPGTVLCYHIGNLAIDRGEDKDLNALGTAVAQAAQSGFVHMRQQRHLDARTGYYVVRTEELSE